MKIYKDNNYGSDIDGNRGTTIYEYDLEDTREERVEIAELLYDSFIDRVYGSKIITYMGIEIEVQTADYLEELIELAKEDGTLYNDLELDKWIKEL